LFEAFFSLLCRSFQDELFAEDVTELGTITVAATCHLLLVIIVIAGGEQVAENHSWHHHLLFLVHDHGNATPVIKDLDRIGDLVNVNPHH